MLTPVAGQRYKVDDLYSFPEDGNRYEIVRGELLVTPAPRGLHQLVVTEFARRIGNHLLETGADALVVVGPADIIYDEDTWVQPDLLVAPKHEITNDWSTCRNLLLVAEVVSPSSARGDRFVKRQAYLEHGVRTYWIVDPHARAVEVWHPGDEVANIVTDTLRWSAGTTTPGLSIPLTAIWAALPS